MKDYHKSAIIMSFALVSFVLGAYWGGMNLQAQSDNAAGGRQSGLIVAPAIVEEDIELGDQAEQTFYVTNTADFPIAIKLELTGYAIDSEGNPYFFPIEESESGLFVLPESEFLISNGARREFKLEMDTKAIGRSGSFLRAIIIKSVAAANQESELAVSIYPNISAVVALNVTESDRKPNHELISFQMAGVKNTLFGDPILAEVMIRNDDQFYQRQDVNISIKNILGDEIYNENYNSLAVLPGSVRNIRGQIDTQLNVGRYSVVFTLEGNGKSETVGFWVQPSLPQVIIGMLCLVLIMVGIRRFDLIRKIRHFMTGKLKLSIYLTKLRKNV